MKTPTHRFLYQNHTPENTHPEPPNLRDAMLNGVVESKKTELDLEKTKLEINTPREQKMPELADFANAKLPVLGDELSAPASGGLIASHEIKGDSGNLLIQTGAINKFAHPFLDTESAQSGGVFLTGNTRINESSTATGYQGNILTNNRKTVHFTGAQLTKDFGNVAVTADVSNTNLEPKVNVAGRVKIDLSKQKNEHGQDPFSGEMLPKS